MHSAAAAGCLLGAAGCVQADTLKHGHAPGAIQIKVDHEQGAGGRNVGASPVLAALDLTIALRTSQVSCLLQGSAAQAAARQRAPWPTPPSDASCGCRTHACNRAPAVRQVLCWHTNHKALLAQTSKPAAVAALLHCL